MRPLFTASFLVAAASLLAAPLCVGQADYQIPQIDSGGRGFTPRPSYNPVPLFFPPNPPPLGHALPRATNPSGRLAAPPELAAYVNEIFYPPLASRLATRTLSSHHRTQLEQYRAAKVALQNELRQELERLRDAEPAARIEALAALARRQTPRIAELERQAEQLRRSLVSSENHWSALREWRLGDKDARGFSPLEIAQVMRGYAFYHHDLLPAQRRLLREIALELVMAADTPDKAAAQQPHLFFPPEPARVSLPDDAPPEVHARMAAYQTQKSVLKKELYDAVHRDDGRTIAFLNLALKKLARTQASRIAELETLAEEIRTGLAAMPEPARMTERTPLPPTLQSRVVALVTRIGAAQRESSRRLEAVLAEAQDARVQARYRFESDGLKYVIVPPRPSRGKRGGQASPENLARVEEVRAQFESVANDYGRQLAELINEKEAIVAEVKTLLGTTATDTVNRAISTAIRVANARETEDAYREYRIAVFQPGLSPEQRRLLFDAVIESLALPLPRGEPQPRRRGNSW